MQNNHKLDIKVDSLVQQLPASSVKVGDLLVLKKQLDGAESGQGGSIGCYTQGGELLGQVPAAMAKRLVGLGDIPASIRSVKKGEHGNIQELLLRVVIGKDGPVNTGKPAQHTPAAKPEYVIDDDGFQLRHVQLQQLVHNQPILSQLADERLQAIITSVDNAPNREQALIAALEKPGFRDFCDQVLDLLDTGLQQVPERTGTSPAT